MDANTIIEATPFEWLTNFSSLSELLDPNYLFPKDENHLQITENRRVLHIGCGSSLLAEHLIRRYEQFSLLVNADNDEQILLGMKLRWNALMKKWKSKDEVITSTTLWTKVDFNHTEVLENRGERNYNYVDYDENDPSEISLDDQFKLQKNYFDLVLDKSTLDCALCSDDATSGLILNAYQSLKADGGVYLVVSFHHVDFIMPLLKNCPGVEWDVEHHVVPRKVDTLSYIDTINSSYAIPAQEPFTDEKEIHDMQTYSHSQQSWYDTDGTFQPDKQYGKYVNVFICRRSQMTSNETATLDRGKIERHIHDCNDLHFKQHNPMVTHVRKEQIKHAFLEQIKFTQQQHLEEKSVISNSEEALLETSVLSLRACYDILFTDAEKEHLGFDYFMEDCNAFSEQHESLCDENGMTCQAAILFLETMQ